jgi:hypothetical protein
MRCKSTNRANFRATAKSAPRLSAAVAHRCAATDRLAQPTPLAWSASPLPPWLRIIADRDGQLDTRFTERIRRFGSRRSAMIAILRKEIARQYLLGPAHKPDKNAPAAPREVIVSSYLP